MRRHGRRPTTPRRDRHLRAVDEPPLQEAADEFIAGVARALADPEPLALLSLASGLASTLDPRSIDPVEALSDGAPDAATFLDSLVGHRTPETTALLLALAVLLPDNYLGQRARSEAARRDDVMPEWLVRLADAEPGATLASLDVLGDGENVVVSMELPGGHPLSAVVYIDHNLGTVVKDAFLIPEGAEGYREHVLALMENRAELTHEGLDLTGMTLEDLDPGEARARILRGIEMSSVLAHRFETDTWPACRPVVEWVIGRLPASGVGFAEPEWTDGQRQSIVGEFLRSPEAAALTGPQDSRIALDLLRFTTDFSGGDPLRWSPVNVEILLSDWYPRTVTAADPYLRRMPTVLRALVRYAHRYKDIPASLTRETLDAVDGWEPVFLDVIGYLGDHAPAPVAGAGGIFGDELMGQWAIHTRQRAAHVVGGEAVLDALDDTPLPDEDFRWEGVPDDVRERVMTVLRLCDGCAEEMFDVEVRTAFRRVLARTAVVDPAVFRRRGKDATAAAAIAWAVATVNDKLHPFTGGLTSKLLLAYFGVSGSVSQRAAPFLRAFGADEYQAAYELTFGTPDVLTAERRAVLIAARDEDTVGLRWS